MLNSGATLKALQARGQQLGNVDFGTYYNRLLGIASLGQNAAAGGVGSNGIAMAKDIAQTDASAASGQASIYGSTAKGIGNQLNTRANYDAYQNSMYGQQQNALYGGQGTGLNYGAGAGGSSSSIYTMTSPSM